MPGICQEGMLAAGIESHMMTTNIIKTLLHYDELNPRSFRQTFLVLFHLRTKVDLHCSAEFQHSADDVGVPQVPLVVTYGAPHAPRLNLNTPRILRVSADKASLYNVQIRNLLTS